MKTVQKKRGSAEIYLKFFIFNGQMKDGVVVGVFSFEQLMNPVEIYPKELVEHMIIALYFLTTSSLPIARKIERIIVKKSLQIGSSIYVNPTFLYYKLFLLLFTREEQDM